MNSYYYTVGEPRVVRGSSGGVSGWKISISYDPDPLQKTFPRSYVRGSVKRNRADSNAKSFRLPGFPTIFPTQEEALASKKAFQDHVEDVVRNGRPLRTPAAAILPAKAVVSAMPKQLAAALRGTRAMKMRARQRCAREKCKLHEKQVVRRAKWQQYRAWSVACLQEHIYSGNTILLLDDPPQRNMRVSPHLSQVT
jgi:hypothetical protein